MNLIESDNMDIYEDPRDIIDKEKEKTYNLIIK